MTYAELDRKALLRIRDEAQQKLNTYEAQHLSLDLTRGKPGRSQLDLTEGMLTALSSGRDCKDEDGLDCRNYGLLDGLPEAKRLFSDLLGIPADRIIVGGNSSLNMMYDAVARLMLYGAAPGKTPYCRQGTVKFLCPTPGYDRHFAISRSFGMEMIPIEMREDGPDMDAVREAVKDPSVKGIWCVPKFSNPDGITYSDKVVGEFAALEPAADDFRIFWDNAYAVHELYDTEVPLRDIFAAAKEYGHEDMIYYFASTSKISFPGSGVAIFASSDANVAYTKKIMSAQTIGFDKLNQLRHVRYFGSADGIRAQMKQHAALIRPKFKVVLDAFRRELPDTGARWTEPLGGYFVSLYVMPGTARRVYELAGKAGVKLTAAGSAFPSGTDPRDSHLRIAPTYPDLDDLRIAVPILCECVKLAAAEKLLG